MPSFIGKKLQEATTPELFDALIESPELKAVAEKCGGSVNRFLYQLSIGRNDTLKESQRIGIAFELFTRGLMEGLYRTKANTLESIALLVRAHRRRTTSAIVALWFDAERRLIEVQEAHSIRFRALNIKDVSDCLTGLLSRGLGLKAKYVVLVRYMDHSESIGDFARYDLRDLKACLAKPLGGAGMELLDFVLVSGNTLTSLFGQVVSDHEV